MNNPIYNRRSVRKYSDKNVPREMIEQVIDAGRMAPSAKNRQPWKYIVLGGESKAEFLEQMKKGIMREENECAFLPDSKMGIPDNSVRNDHTKSLTGDIITASNAKGGQE